MNLKHAHRVLWIAAAFVFVVGTATLVTSHIWGINWSGGGGTFVGLHDGSVHVFRAEPVRAGGMVQFVGVDPGLTVGGTPGTIRVTGASIRTYRYPGVLWKYPFGVGCVLAAGAWFMMRRACRVALDSEHCVHCGYDVRGLGTCPECGTLVSGAGSMTGAHGGHG